MDAREYFARRGARLTFEHARALLGRRREAAALVELGVDGIRPRHVPGAGGGTCGMTGDPTARLAEFRMTTARDIYSRELARLADTDAFLADVARLVEGIGKGLGGRYAVALSAYYVDGMAWDDAAAAADVSRRHALRLRDTACDWADAVGWHRAVRGLGVAK